jgi:multidrug efflux system membrane fusion protein
MRHRWFWLLLPLPLLVVGALAWQLTRESASAAATAAPTPPPTVPIIAGTAVAQDMPIYLVGLGTVQAFNTVTVKPRIDGQIDKIAFTEGQDVKTGDVLAQIDPRALQAALAQTLANKAKDAAQLANAKRDLERFTTLAQRDYATKQSVDTQRSLIDSLTAAIQGDDAAIDNTRVQLSYATIAAPISGRTGVRLVDQGNIVHAGDPNGIVVITQLKPISVLFTLPQDTLDAVAAAMAKRPVTVGAFKRDDETRLGDGVVALVDNQIDPATGTIHLKATFPNADLRLWPGQFVNIHLLLDVVHNAVTVPAQVVQRGPDGTFAYVIKPDSTVEPRKIKVGETRDGTAMIEQGLAAGERVVVDGQYKIRPGIRVDPGTASPSGTQGGASVAPGPLS